VENAEALRELRELGCDLAQGFAISPPLAAAELREWLAAGGWSPPGASDAPPGRTGASPRVARRSI
jgi:predicted signal transduction protein with EAL and GGDEF domain